LLVLLVLVASIAALGAGCGGDDDDAPSTAEIKAAYLEKANAACREERTGLQDEISTFLRLQRGKPPQVRYAETTQSVLLPSVEDELEAIRALRPPPGEARRIDDLLYAEQAVLVEMVFEPRQPSMEAAIRRFVEPGKLLRAYGLPACANGPGTYEGGGA
jgi:hypothetical protein